MDEPITGLIRLSQGGGVDITQQSCIKLASSLAQYRSQAAYTSWLYQLVISCARDWQRTQRRHEHDSLPNHEPTAGGAGRAEDCIYPVQLLDQFDECRLAGVVD